MNTQNLTQPDAELAHARSATAHAPTTREMVEKAGSELKSRLGSMVESGKTKVGEWKGGFEDTVRERPIQSVLIAVAVGTVVGLLIGRRSR
jgi:ElaB/YqjD/DUF883 family membrane-anchored ribosome-binding protein